MIDGVPLTVVTFQKYLGITFDSKLDWTAHISAICKKMSFYLFWINSHRKSLPTEVIKMLIDSLLLSCLMYAHCQSGVLYYLSLTFSICNFYTTGAYALLHPLENLTMSQSNALNFTG